MATCVLLVFLGALCTPGVGMTVGENTTVQLESRSLDTKREARPEIPVSVDARSYIPRLQSGLTRGIEVLFDTTTDGGGWIVFQRRTKGDTDFYRNWEDYKHGFGPLFGDFWLGNEKIHQLTKTGFFELRVDLQYYNSKFYAVFDKFSVASEKDKYRVTVGRHSGRAGDSFSHHSNMMFSTYDSDNDLKKRVNCAVANHGGWWYHECQFSNLNGLWGSKTIQGVNWDTLTGYQDSVQSTEMKFRPV